MENIYQKPFNFCLNQSAVSGAFALANVIQFYLSWEEPLVTKELNRVFVQLYPSFSGNSENFRINWREDN